MIKEENTVIQNTKDKLIAKLEPSGWAKLLRLFLNSEDFIKIIEKLYSEAKEEGHHFTPPLKNVFRAFEECSFDDVKVVVIGQDPYFYKDVADGIAFSCSLTGKEQPSLRYIFNGIEKHVYNDGPMDRNPDLTRWANQGVLLLNSAFTCQIDKPGSHFEIWRDFMIYLLDMLQLRKPDLIYVLLGKQAETFSVHLTGTVIKTTHPASAAYSKQKDWAGASAFKKVNELLKENFIEEIKW